MKPNLACPTPDDLSTLSYPVLLSPKLDGIRALVSDSKLLSRSLKLIPNKHIQSLLARPLLEGFDGELIVGDPWGKTVYTDTVSAVMRHDGAPDVRFYAFDMHNMPNVYVERWHELQRIAEKLTGLPVDVLDQVYAHNEAEFLAFEEACLDKGFEGVMSRSPRGLYKFGRSTTKEGGLLKRKLFEDSECRILGIEEEMFNGNEAQTNELGRTKRSTAKEGLVGKGTMGALIVKDIHHGWKFNIGTGFTAAQRAAEWKTGSVHTYKFFRPGMKDVPRHPVYKGPRDKRDMSA